MKTRIPIIFPHDLPRCEQCGAPLSSPGICAPCAEVIYSVSRPIRVLPRVTEVDAMQIWAENVPSLAD